MGSLGKGLNMVEISRTLGVRAIRVSSVIRAHGGIQPAVRHRSVHHFNSAEREMISRGLVAGCSMREMARHLKRAASSVSREVARNAGIRGYRAVNADQRAWWRGRRPKVCLLARQDQLRRMVTAKLLIDWSPQQISGWLKKTYPDDESMRVSHETIYRSLFIQARGALKVELTAHLRRGRSMRRCRQLLPIRHGIVDAISIRERPAEVADRAIPGHWEGDLLCGSETSQITTLVERKSRFLMLVKTPSKNTQQLVAALSKQVRKLLPSCAAP